MSFFPVIVGRCIIVAVSSTQIGKEGLQQVEGVQSENDCEHLPQISHFLESVFKRFFAVIVVGVFVRMKAEALWNEMQNSVSEHSSDSKTDESRNDRFVDSFPQTRNQQNTANRSHGNDED